MSPARAGDSRLRAVFISDVHLGSRHCHAAELAEFLAGLQCRKLYLVGDIVDLWWLAQKRAVWGAAQHRVVEALHALARKGTELIYVPGNHDRPIRRFCGLMLPQMSVRRRVIHTLLDGRRLLVTHGDDYDAATRWQLSLPVGNSSAPPTPIASSKRDEAIAPFTQGGWRGFVRNLEYELGDWLYYVILHGNRMTNALRRRFGLRYWSLADFLKRQSGAAERYIERFMHAGLADARRRGLDGIVCGHIHRADLCTVEGLVYANDGDWVESLSALAEDAEGNLCLIEHGGIERIRLHSRARPLRLLPQAA